ncbi:MAG: 6-hydroxymethylpterin diphosphokinase MptE-like protein [Lachnospiraceae bacterium]|nr:6-hydroxymethylpterin diphosphokinase MptE-like protein [Lachnospiraceae bacterium]
MNLIPQLTNLTENITATIEYFRIQDFFHGNIAFNRVVNSLNQLLPMFTDEEISLITDNLGTILNAQSEADYVLLADMLEISLLASVKNILESRISTDATNPSPEYLENNLEVLKNADNSGKYNSLITLIQKNSAKYTSSFSTQTKYIYNIEQTNIGVPTLKVTTNDKSVYYHSNVNPFSEGRMLAKYYAKPDTYNYNIFGFGFGYHIKALLDLDRRFRINAIETNIEVLTMAFMYIDLADILSNDRFSLEYCPLDNFADSFKSLLSNPENSSLLIHYPSLCTLEDGVLKQSLNNYFINFSSMYSQEKYLNWNFYYNMKLNSRPVDTLKDDFKSKDIIYVAAGPSLNYYFDYLKKNMVSDNTIIICASTIYRTLLNKNIIPDYVIMTDAQDNMISHIKDIDKTGSSLIYLSTACSNAVAAFNGDKYILFQYGYEPAENYANKNHLSLIETGGSVSTSAIDLILRFNCKSLTTIGLDLAYTDNKTHSYDTKNVDTSNRYIYVKSVKGESIPTTNILNIYRKWIENRIKDVKNIKLVNMSHGAYIEGMENVG